MSKNIIPTAEPFYFPGGSTGCLLVHGFTGTPKEMRWMGEYLSARGYSVLGIRLFAHATKPEDMQRARWHDWLASVEDGLHILSGVTERIFIIGLSMGGALSLLTAARFSPAGVIAMSTPYSLTDDLRLRFVKFLSRFMPEIPKGDEDWSDKTAGVDHVAYPHYPTRAIAELRDLLSAMRTSLPSIHSPVLLMHARCDTAGGGFDPDSMQKIYDNVGSPDKKMIWIENSGHVISRDASKDLVFASANKFIKQVTNPQD